MKLTLTIPSSLKEITLNQYQQWIKIAEGKEVSQFLKQKMIEIFCNITLKQVLSIKAKDIDIIVEDISKLFKDTSDLISVFVLDGKKYGFEPKLDDISFGAYIDVDTYLEDWQQMHKAMSVLFRPVILQKKKKWYNFLMWWSINEDQYLIEDYVSANKYDLKEMSLDVVFGCLSFFFCLKRELLNHTLNSLANQTQMPLPQGMKASLKNMAGISRSMGLQWVTS